MMGADSGTSGNPNRYFDHIGAARGPIAEAEPVCLYLETTNRCNLLCTTCPRTFEELEPPADMSWELFTADRRPVSADRPRRAARGRRADDGARAAAHDPLSEGSRHLCAVQHQRHPADRAQGAGADRQRARRAARVARRRRAGGVQAGARARHVRPDRPQCAALSGRCSARRRREAARLAVADRAEGDDRAAADFVRLAHEMDVPRSICSASSISPRGRGWRGPIRHCSPEATSRGSG